MAYTIPIVIPKCGDCGNEAKFELRNHTNQTVNYYCKHHQARGLERLQAIEDRELERGIAQREGSLAAMQRIIDGGIAANVHRRGVGGDGGGWPASGRHG